MAEGEKTKEHSYRTRQTRGDLLTKSFLQMGAGIGAERDTERNEEKDNADGGEIGIAVGGEVEIELDIISFPKSRERGKKKENKPGYSEGKEWKIAPGNPGEREEDDDYEKWEEEIGIPKGYRIGVRIEDG